MDERSLHENEAMSISTHLGSSTDLPTDGIPPTPERPATGDSMRNAALIAKAPNAGSRVDTLGGLLILLASVWLLTPSGLQQAQWLCQNMAYFCSCIPSQSDFILLMGWMGNGMATERKTKYEIVSLWRLD